MARAERPAGLTVMEKLMGLVLLAIGALAIYYAVEASEALGSYWLLFTGMGCFLAVIGLAVILAKPE
ncbi:hypothetical protein B6U66_01400 [Candidatus Bathyarchaeota archaeon ex4484_135]|nr:MAG: hypothetical protein B6U66_01400 [Candidatus Bathyarchaeota archaeon ex4484_135]